MSIAKVLEFARNNPQRARDIARNYTASPEVIAEARRVYLLCPTSFGDAPVARSITLETMTHA